MGREYPAIGLGGQAARWLLALLVVGLSCGCSSSRPLTEADCQAVGEALSAAWLADANGAIAVADTEQFRRFVVDEGKSIAKRWMAQCRPQIGQAVNPAELDCLRRARRIEDVGTCAGRYGASGGG